jgi:hypothetical protein
LEEVDLDLGFSYGEAMKAVEIAVEPNPGLEIAVGLAELLSELLFELLLLALSTKTVKL